MLGSDELFFPLRIIYRYAQKLFLNDLARDKKNLYVYTTFRENSKYYYCDALLIFTIMKLTSGRKHRFAHCA